MLTWFPDPTANFEQTTKLKLDLQKCSTLKIFLEKVSQDPLSSQNYLFCLKPCEEHPRIGKIMKISQNIVPLFLSLYQFYFNSHESVLSRFIRENHNDQFKRLIPVINAISSVIIITLYTDTMSVNISMSVSNISSVSHCSGLIIMVKIYFC